MEFRAAAVQRFLGERRVMSLATVNPDGAPLVTPVWFSHTSEACYVYSMTTSRKVRNIMANSKVSAAVESGERAADIRFVILRGTGTILDDPEEIGAATEALLGRYGAELRQRWGMSRLPPDRSMVRITPAAVFARGLA